MLQVNLWLMAAAAGRRQCGLRAAEGRSSEEEPTVPRVPTLCAPRDSIQPTTSKWICFELCGHA